MAIDPRVLWWALVPILLIVCVTVALWDLRGQDGRGVSDPPRQHQSQERIKAPAGGSTHALSASAAIRASACGDHSTRVYAPSRRKMGKVGAKPRCRRTMITTSDA
jgi:hypothetical protein